MRERREAGRERVSARVHNLQGFLVYVMAWMPPQLSSSASILSLASLSLWPPLLPPPGACTCSGMYMGEGVVHLGLVDALLLLDHVHPGRTPRLPPADDTAPPRQKFFWQAMSLPPSKDKKGRRGNMNPLRRLVPVAVVVVILASRELPYPDFSGLSSLPAHFISFVDITPPRGFTFSPLREARMPPC